VGLRKGNRGKESVQDRTAPRNDVPVGMAARSRGRFMTQTEFEDTGAASTDTGLDALCGTPEFAKWMRQQAHRVRLTSRDFSDSDDG
jgi:hypothetical protein